jgi:hypothetical protein
MNSKIVFFICSQSIAYIGTDRITKKMTDSKYFSTQRKGNDKYINLTCRYEIDSDTQR